MKLALLGIDDSLVLLSQAIAADPQHEIVSICGKGEAVSNVLAAHPAAARESDWETLLLGCAFDLLVIGDDGEIPTLRTEQLRRLVQEGVPLVLVQPPAEAIVLHEIAMIQSDTRSRVAVWNPVLSHPAVLRIREWLEADSSSATAVTNVSLQRALAERSWKSVQRSLARDGQWVRQLIGPPQRVTALATEASGEALNTLAVTFVGPGDALAQWTLGSPSTDDVVTITAARGQVSWRTTRDGQSQLTIESPDESAEQSWSAEETRQTLGKNFVAFLQSDHAEDDPQSLDHATRAVELAEAARESNRRSRTIHLHYEEHSEQQTFKSVMAAGGCLLLLAVLCLLGGSIAIDSIGAPVRNSPWWRIWPVYLLAPIVLFLLLQTLWRVFASPRPSRQRSSDSDTAEN